MLSIRPPFGRGIGNKRGVIFYLPKGGRVNAGDNITSNPLKLFKALEHFPQMVAYFISTSILMKHNFFIARSEPRAARLYIAHNSRLTILTPHASRFSRLTPHEVFFTTLSRPTYYLPLTTFNF